MAREQGGGQWKERRPNLGPKPDWMWKAHREHSAAKQSSESEIRHTPRRSSSPAPTRQQSSCYRAHSRDQHRRSRSRPRDSCRRSRSSPHPRGSHSPVDSEGHQPQQTFRRPTPYLHTTSTPAHLTSNRLAELLVSNGSQLTLPVHLQKRDSEDSRSHARAPYPPSGRTCTALLPQVGEASGSTSLPHHRSSQAHPFRPIPFATLPSPLTTPSFQALAPQCPHFLSPPVAPPPTPLPLPPPSNVLSTTESLTKRRSGFGGRCV